MKNVLKFGFIFCLFTLISCDSSPLNIDVSEVPSNLKVHDYGSALFEADYYHIEDSLDQWAKKFPAFINGDYKNSARVQGLKDYINNELNQILYKAYKAKEPAFNTAIQELEEATKHYQYYYPEDQLPPIDLYISSINYERPIILTDVSIIVAADLFLGQDFEEYKKQQIPLFISHGFDTKYLSTTIYRSIAQHKFKGFLNGGTMLEKMIALGKIEYFLEALHPTQPDSIRLQFTPDQMQWCYEREAAFWKHITTSGMLFSKDYHDYKKYLEPRPFASSLEKDSPGRAGVFIGYRIVQSYMKRNSDVTLQTLMTETDMNKIFRLSKYNP